MLCAPHVCVVQETTLLAPLPSLLLALPLSPPLQLRPNRRWPLQLRNPRHRLQRLTRTPRTCPQHSHTRFQQLWKSTDLTGRPRVSVRAALRNRATPTKRRWIRSFQAVTRWMTLCSRRNSCLCHEDSIRRVSEQTGLQHATDPMPRCALGTDSLLGGPLRSNSGSSTDLTLRGPRTWSGAQA